MTITLDDVDDRDKITRTAEIEIELEPEEAARIFLRADSDWQREFFESMAAIVESEWDGGSLVMQLEYVIGSEDSPSGLIDSKGARIMRTIGEYGSAAIERGSV